MEPFPSVVKSANPSAKRAFTGTHYFPPDRSVPEPPP